MRPRPVVRLFAAVYDVALNAAEGGVMGFVGFVLLVWLWPWTPPQWASLATQLDWAAGFVALGAGVGAGRGWIERQRETSR